MKTGFIDAVIHFQWPFLFCVINLKKNNTIMATKAYFFKDDKCAQMDITTNKLDKGFPKKISEI